MEEMSKKINEFNKKYGWYAGLLVASSIYVFIHKYEIYQLTELNAENLIFLLWIVLLLMPLFSEIEIGNLKLKREIEETRAEVKESIGELKYQILEMRINNTNSNSNTVVLGTQPLPSKDELSEMQRHVDKSQDIRFENEVTFNVTEADIYLFKVRLDLEKQLLALCKMFSYNERKTMHSMINTLIQHEVIDYDMAGLIREIVNIANRGVHGEIVDNEYIQFVENTYPMIKKRLKKEYTYFTNNSYYFECKKCHYQGPSKFRNECPKCGSTSN